MNQGFNILGVAGILRRQSYNRAALEAAKQNAPERFDQDGRLIDEVSKKLIRQLLLNLEDWANRINPKNQPNEDRRTEPAAILTNNRTDQHAQA